MTRALPLLLLAAIVSGCAAAELSRSAATLVVLDGTDPAFLDVRLSNEGDGPIPVSWAGFRIVDALGRQAEIEADRMPQFGAYAFPAAATLAAGESAEGTISFGEFEGTRPYAVRYDHGGTSAAAPLG